MATRYAVATGNWSNTATWDGGTLPTTADDVHANNRTVTIDQNVTVLSLRTTAGGAAVAGGGFSIPNGSSYNVTATNGFIAGSNSVLTITGTGTRVITGNATGSATTATVNTIYVTHSSGNIPNVTINGNLLGGGQSNSVALYIWGGYVTVNGSVTGGAASTNTHGINIFNGDNQPTQLTVNTGPITGGSSSSGSCTGINVGYSPTGSALTNSFININCNIVGGTVGNNNHAYNSSSTIPLTVVGNITSGTTSSGINSTTVNVAGSSVSITGTCTAGLVTAVQVSAFSVTILGDMVGGAGTNTGGLLYGGIGTCTVTGTIYGSTSNINGRGIYAGFNTPGHLIVNGDVYARNGVGISNTGNGQITVNGNIYGGTATNANGMNPSATNLITVNGNVLGGSGSGACGIFTSSTPTIIVNGNVTGGTNINAIGVRQASSGIVTINGTVTAGTGSNAQGAANIGTGTITAKRAKGNDYGAGSVGIQQAYALTSEAQGSVTYVEEIEMGSRGAFPLFNHVLFTNVNTNSASFYTTGLASVKTLVDPNATGLMPSASNVRLGTTYASGNFTGTMAVPAASSVAAGVAVDNTVGTAVLTQANVWNYALSSASSTPGSVGEKLKKTAIPADIIALG
jgi:hypothetical protein